MSIHYRKSFTCDYTVQSLNRASQRMAQAHSAHALISKAETVPVFDVEMSAAELLMHGILLRDG